MMNSRPSRQKILYIRFFIVAIMLTIAAGWMLTDFLGKTAEKEFKEMVNREAKLTSFFLHDNLDDVTNAAKALGPAEAIVAALSTASPADLERANKLLDRIKNSFEMTVCYLLDKKGLVIASSNRNEINSFAGKSFATRPYFTGALTGRPTTYFALGLFTRERGYYAAVPVIDSAGTITGVVVIKRDIAPVEDFFRKYTHVFLVSPEGIIFITSREELLFRSLWPVDEKRRAELVASRQFGNISFKPLLAAAPRTGTYVRFENEKLYVQSLPFGSDGWTLVFMDAPHIISTYRLFGILVTSMFGLLLAFSFYVLLQKEKTLEAAGELREAHQRALDIIQFYPDATMVVDSESKVVAWNLAMEELTGVQAEEMLDRGNYEYALPFYGERRPILIDFALQPAEKFDGKYEYTERSGQIIIGETFVHNTRGEDLYIHGTAAALYNSSGEITGAIESIRDITARKQIEVELTKQERLASLRAEIGGALGQNLDLQPILQRCAELLVRYLDVAFFRIWTLNDAEQTLEMQASAGMYTHIDGPHGRVPVGKFKIGMIASERQPHLTNDVMNDPRIGDKEWARREGMIAFAGYPLIVADRLVGVMATFARTTFNEEILGELGSVAGRIAQCIERKRAEELLRKTELRLSNTMNLAQLVDWEYDVASGFFVFNDRYYTLHGTTSELEGGNLMSAEAFTHKFVHPDNVHNVGEEIAKALATTDPDYHSQLEACILRRDGEVRHVSVYIAITQNAAGRTIRLHGANQDITARNQMEVKLKKATAEAEENAQRLEFVLEGSNDATWEWDIIADHAVLNSRYYEMIEYTPGEVNPTTEFFLSTIHPEDLSEVQRRLQDNLEGKTGEYEAHYRMVTKSGKLKDVMGRGKIVRRDENGRPNLVAGVITDVTEMKRLSDEVNKIHNLESIGLLAGGLAHDFNNVLNIIYGNISFAKMLAGGNTPVIEPLTDAEEACERATELGIRLQALSQSSSPVKELITLPAIIGDTAEALFKDSHTSYKISVEDNVHQVEGDPRQIRQVFKHLLTNSREAMSSGGTVKIDISNYVADGKKRTFSGSGPYVCIALQDSGKGIPEENLRKIFDHYFSTKETYSQKGLGLGLTVCHAILKRHDGHIFVESTIGVGTRVTLYLPALVADKDIEAEVGRIE